MKIKRTILWIGLSLFIIAAIVYQVFKGEHKQSLKSFNQVPDTLEINSLIKKADYYFDKPKRTKDDLDSSLLITTSIYRISKKLDYKKGIGTAYNTYSKSYHINGDTLKGRKYADSAITVFKDNSLYYDLGFAYYNRSGFYPLDGKLLKLRIEYVKLAANAFTQSGSKLKQGDIYKELADLQQYDLNYNDALINLKKSLTFYDSTNYHALVGVYDLLGLVNSETGNYRLGLKYGLIALRIAGLSDTTSTTVATLYNRIGLNYEHMRKYPDAFRYYSKGQQICLMNKDSISWMILTLNKAKMLNYMGHTQEAIQNVIRIPRKLLKSERKLMIHIHATLLTFYLKLKEYDKCRIYSQLLLKDYAYAKQMGIPTIAINPALTKYYLDINELEKAEYYLRENDLVLKQFKIFTDLRASYKLWARLDSAKGDFEACVNHLKQFQLLSDSSMSESNNQQIAQLQMEYESEKKDKAILLKEERIKLLGAENRVQQANLKQAVLVQNVTIGGVVLLIIIVVLLYSSYRLKNSSNRKVNMKNTSLNKLVTEKEWLLKEIHHRVKNNLQIIISLLDSQSMYLRDRAALNAIRDSQSRVHCMALIHKKLYQSDRVASINMKLYVEELVDYLSSTFNVQTSICFELNIEELQLTTAQSIPIGLILNEAITNSIKYAFPERNADNLIKVKLNAETNQCRIVVNDNGIGLPDGFSKENDKSLGVNLMKGLSEDIEASFSMWSEEGTHIEIVFQVQQLTPLLMATEQSMVLTTIS